MHELCLTCALSDGCPCQDRLIEADDAACDLRMMEEHERKRREYDLEWMAYLRESGYDFDL